MRKDSRARPGAVGKMASDERGRADSARHKRGEQLRRWTGSQTDSESPVMKKKKLAKVKFDDGAVFLAACSSGDTEEVLRLLERGADINHSNVDGLSALHQACIDENIDMVRFLVECGANINQADNEGWTPLHAAASCGYFDIAKYLLHHGVSVAAVNNEGELPLDITEDEAMEEMLQEELNRQGVDVEAARKEEQQLMLRDARQWLNRGQVQDVRHPKSGGSALHVAAAKSYVDVLKLLIQTGMDINVRDNDGWTPLHAAAHWGKEEACHILVENLCDMHAVNKVGQTPFDVADEDILGYLEELVAKQKALRSEKELKDQEEKLIDINNTRSTTTQLKSRTSISRMASKEKQRGEDRMQERHTIERAKEGDVSLHKDDSSSSSSDSEYERECSETEEETAENADKKVELIENMNKLNNNDGVPVPARCVPSSLHIATTTSTTTIVTPTPALPSPITPASPFKKRVEFLDLAECFHVSRVSRFPTLPEARHEDIHSDDRRDESPATWRQGLRKTGSYGALPEAGGTGTTQGVLREKDPSSLMTTGLIRSASSPRLTTAETRERDKLEKDIERRLARVLPTISDGKTVITRRTSSSDAEEKENRDSTGHFGSLLRRRYDDEKKESILGPIGDGTTGTGQMPPSYRRSESYLLAVGRSSSVPRLTSLYGEPDGRPSFKHFPNNGGIDRNQFPHRIPIRRVLFSHNEWWLGCNSGPPRNDSYGQREDGTRPSNVTASLPATVPTDAGGSSENRERRRSYLTPVRDEESESQRKARSRQARQTRRSTQGITLTDLREAEKIRMSSSDQRAKEQPSQEEGRQDSNRTGLETKDTVDSRVRYVRNPITEETNQRTRVTSSAAGTVLLQASKGNSSSISDSVAQSRTKASSGSSTPTFATSEADSNGESAEEEVSADGERQEGKARLSVRERRRPREKRRSTGVSYRPLDSQSDEPSEHDESNEDEVEKGHGEKEKEEAPAGGISSRYNTANTSTGFSDNYRDRYAKRMGRIESQNSELSRRTASTGRLGDRGDSKYNKVQDDAVEEKVKLHKKLQETQQQLSETVGENEKLRKKLQDTQLQLAEAKVQLERVTQRQERFADRTSLLEAEKREKRALERKVSEMEEELKTLGELKGDNQRLKDENAALIRVISKLSK
uniref:protein phosphatase 1 regulatory subunit 12A n=1 Tax=Myxine glutinosa TaxID=7769 RepID=UPI00358FBB71